MMFDYTHSFALKPSKIIHILGVFKGEAAHKDPKALVVKICLTRLSDQFQ